MAGFAGCFSVLPAQGISSNCMIKLIGIKADYLKVAAMMITMAFNTILPFKLRRSVISPVFRYSDPNIKVTIQTFLIGNLLSQGVTFGTV
jgi:hypothetical protein